MENALSPDALDELFGRNAERQYTRRLLKCGAPHFSNYVKLPYM